MSDAPRPAGLPEGFRPLVDPAASFDGVWGLELLDLGEGDGIATGRIVVDERHHGEAGSLHSGVVAAAAEAIASMGTFRGVLADGASGQGLSNDTTLLADVRAGAVTFRAVPLHRGEREWLWTVDARDAAGALVAHSRVTVAVRPLTSEQLAAMRVDGEPGAA